MTGARKNRPLYPYRVRCDEPDGFEKIGRLFYARSEGHALDQARKAGFAAKSAVRLAHESARAT